MEEPSVEKPNLIFLEISDNSYVLKELINNSYSTFNVPISSTVLVQDISKIFTLIRYENNNQIWDSSGGGINPSQTLYLTNSTKSLITSGPVDINNTLTTNNLSIQSSSNEGLTSFTTSNNQKLNISYDKLNDKFISQYNLSITNYYCEKDFIYFTEIYNCTLYKYSITDNSYSVVYEDTDEEHYKLPMILFGENNNFYIVCVDYDTYNYDLYILKYNSQTGTYTSDLKIDFEENYMNAIKCKNDKIYYTYGRFTSYLCIYDINNDTIDFATHGDYIFKIKNNVEHNITSGGSRLYQIGDKILYNGTIIDPDTPITSRLLTNCIGTITYIPSNNDYVSLFKS